MSRQDNQTQRETMTTSSGGTVVIRSETERDFDRAKKQAFIQDALAFLRFDSPDLIPFETVRDQLGLGEKVYRGILSIPIDQIIGSVGRWGDFTRTFFPRSEKIRDRWQRIDRMKNIRGISPIQAYKVGLVYFVLDGNHRVSVARQAGAKSIEGHVWEYETRVPLEPDDSIRDVLIRREYLSFLERTGLDETRPEIYIILTAPGRYRDFEEQIAIHRHYLEIDRGECVSFRQAAVEWYDHVYISILDIIHREDMLQTFPGRTEADLVNWIIRNRFRLRQKYGFDNVPTLDLVRAATDLGRPRLWQQIVSWFRRKVLRWPVYTGKPWEPD